ncbi:serine/threonine-protein phosphatase [Neisseriaceae bacterium TC5R-5]|nr:serine/threonine-protein phosphatase [Neisseriaceae bacterium TC5R-5]
MHTQMAAPLGKALEHGICTRPYFGERVSGDGQLIRQTEQGWFLAMLDVLGHGEEAHVLARQMEAWLQQQAWQPLPACMQAMHQQFKGSRGAAVCLVQLDKDGGLRCVSVGNTLLRVLQASEQVLTGQPGTVGYVLPTLSEQCLQLAPGALLLLTTDGVPEHFPAGVLQSWRHLPLARLSNQLINDYAKWHDDASCVAVRWEP